MKRYWFLVSLFFAPMVSAAEAHGDSVMGIYEGFWGSKDGRKGRMTAQVRAIGGGKYDGFMVLYRAKSLEAAAQLKPGALKFEFAPLKSSDGSLMAQVTGEAGIVDGKLIGKFKGELGTGTFEAKLGRLKSDFVGAKPPKNGVVLFDGKTTNGWSDFRWKVTPEGTMVVSGGDLKAKEKYSNFLLHLEFRTPLMAEARGQARGNSGVYLQNKYEVQVLDSFGLYPLQNNDCGAIYSVKAPEGNVCLPPGEWQTYDITFVDAEPAKKKGPRITVMQNGVTVIDRFELPKEVVEKGTGGNEPDGSFLRLQDHGNAVEYRNIWVEPFFANDRRR